MRGRSTSSDRASPQEGSSAPSLRVGFVLLPRFTLKGRALWKNVHAVMGIWLALGALAFVLTGLPWTGSWGKQFKALATAANLGAPPGSWGGLPLQSAMPGKSGMQPSAVQLKRPYFIENKIVDFGIGCGR